MATLACDRVGRRTLFLVSYFVAFVSLCMASAAMIYGGEFEDDDSSSKEDWSCGPPTSGPKNQVWHKTQSMTPCLGKYFSLPFLPPTTCSPSRTLDSSRALLAEL